MYIYVSVCLFVCLGMCIHIYLYVCVRGFDPEFSILTVRQNCIYYHWESD